jgi:2-C-methyl-D-erythritol 4-phosphate cytidylyltransferase
VTACITGGEMRADSVRAGIGEVPSDAAVAVVHDAARPLVPSDVIERVIAPLGEGWDGAVPALPIADTLKRAGDGGAVAETVSRDGLYGVQTPQAFVTETLRSALASPVDDASDCARFVEAAGGRILLVPGDPQLVKVTTTADLAFVERLVAGAGAESS